MLAATLKPIYVYLPKLRLDQNPAWSGMLYSRL